MDRLMTKQTEWRVRTAKTQISLGIRHAAKRSSNSRLVYPEVKLQGRDLLCPQQRYATVRDLVRVVGIVAPFTTGVAMWLNVVLTPG